MVNIGACSGTYHRRSKQGICCKLLWVVCGEGLEFGGEFTDDRRDCDGWTEGNEFEVRVSGQPIGY